MNIEDLLNATHTFLVIDWPSKDVPEGLVQAGFRVIVKGGPSPDDYSVYEMEAQSAIASRPLGHPPERAEIVYSYRPLEELPEIIQLAKQVAATALWLQTGYSGPGVRDVEGCWMAEEERDSSEHLVRSAGLQLLTSPYIVHAVREHSRASKKNVR